MNKEYIYFTLGFMCWCITLTYNNFWFRYSASIIFFILYAVAAIKSNAFNKQYEDHEDDLS